MEIGKNTFIEMKMKYTFTYTCVRGSSYYQLKIKLNLWFTAPKGATPVNQTPATDWQMAV